MNRHPVVEMLIRRWAMPAERAPTVARLLEVCAQGATALALTEPGTTQEWGPAALPASLCDPVNPPPLVLSRQQDRDLLQTWAHHRAELEIANSLLRRITGPGAQTELTASQLRRLEDLFITPGESDPYRGQFDAARTALSNRFALITGGPGTGKTTTLARILALSLEAHAGPPETLRIVLAAPTGKAAQRMREAVEAAIAGLESPLPGLHEALRTAARSACTLHKLLGYNPADGRCRHNAENPLHADLLVIDEASMIDLMLWRALLEATPLATRLLVLGDPFQLESVAAGRVLADLVEAANPPDGAWISPLETCSANLSKSFRFEKRKDIARLASLIGHQDADAVVALLEQRRDEAAPDGLAWLGEIEGAPNWHHLPRRVQDAILGIAQAPGPGEALAALSSVCILSAHREHAFGALGLSSMIDRNLFRLCRRSDGHVHNQPIIINRNDPETGLANGSVGVLCNDPVRGRLAWFPAAEAGAEPRSFSIGKLPDYSPAWALTIHRSQGSEYDNVHILLPKDDSPLATRELLYTAITRARAVVTLCGPLATVRKAVTLEQLRTTCLRGLLSRQADKPSGRMGAD